MAIEVLIKRKVRPGLQAEKLIPLILQLRALAAVQPGYISGETYYNIDRPEECLVRSKWESIDHWRRWLEHGRRTALNARIEEIAGSPTTYDIYAPLVAGSGEFHTT